MSVNFTANVLRPSGQKGMIKNGERGQSYQCQAYTEDNAKLVVGDFVKLKDVVNVSTPVVEKISATTDEPFGVIAYNAVKNEFENGDMLTVCSDYTILALEASAAISAGSKVMPVIAEQKVATATATNYAIGIALQKASATGDLIDVLIKKPEKIAAGS